MLFLKKNKMKLYSKILLISITSSLLVFTITNRIDNKYDSKLTSKLFDNEFSSMSIPANFNQNRYTNSSLPDLTFAASKSIDAVVHVKNTSIVKDSDSKALKYYYGDDSRKKVGTGSGVIISPDGYIIQIIMLLKTLQKLLLQQMIIESMKQK